MGNRFSRRDFVKVAGVSAAAMATPTISFAQADRDTLRFGWAISKTGPFTAGASSTQIPNYRLWVDDVNKAGGLMVDGKKKLIEVFEYDDRSQPEEAVRAIDRLVNQDKVDFLLPPWGTGMNMAVAPVFFRNKFPMIAPTFITERMPELVKRWDNVFALLQPNAPYGTAIVDVLQEMRKAGKINNRVAIVNVTDQGGIELVKAARDAFANTDFEIVHEAGYPIGTQDLTPIITAAQQSNPDVFLAFSYPPDSMGLTEAARVRGFNPKVFYIGVGSALPIYRKRFAAATEGVMGPGGWNPETPELQAYLERFQALNGGLPDQWVSYLCYSGLQALGQAIETVGTVDRPAIIKVLQQETFDTISGPLRFENNIARDAWLVGQWQGDTFWGVAPKDREGAKPIIDKPNWS